MGCCCASLSFTRCWLRQIQVLHSYEHCATKVTNCNFEVLLGCCSFHSSSRTTVYFIYHFIISDPIFFNQVVLEGRWSQGFMAMAAVGATNVGSIEVWPVLYDLDFVACFLDHIEHVNRFGTIMINRVSFWQRHLNFAVEVWTWAENKYSKSRIISGHHKLTHLWTKWS